MARDPLAHTGTPDTDSSGSTLASATLTVGGSNGGGPVPWPGYNRRVCHPEKKNPTSADIAAVERISSDSALAAISHYLPRAGAYVFWFGQGQRTNAVRQLFRTNEMGGTWSNPLMRAYRRSIYPRIGFDRSARCSTKTSGRYERRNRTPRGRSCMHEKLIRLGTTSN